MAMLDVPIMNFTFQQLLDKQVEAYPFRDTYESEIEDLKWTTKDLIKHIRATYGGLHALSGRKSVTYTTALPLRAEVLTGLLGSARAGKMFASIQPAITEKLLYETKKNNKNNLFFPRQDLNSMSTETLLFCPKYGNKNQLEDFYNVFPWMLYTHPMAILPLNEKKVPHLLRIYHTAKKVLNGISMTKTMLSYDYQDYNFKRKGTIPQITFDAPYSLLFNNQEKVVALSQYNLINTANSVAKAINLTQSDSVINTLQPYTASGQTLGLMLPLVSRSKIVVPYEVPSLKVSLILEAIPKHGCNTLIANIEVWNLLLKTSDTKQLKNFREKIKKAVIVADDQVLDSGFIDSIREFFSLENLHVIQGIPETSGALLVDGKPIPNVNIKLIDPSTGKESSSGIIYVDGVNVFKGYWNVDQTLILPSITEDGWYKTTLKATKENGVYKLNQ